MSARSSAFCTRNETWLAAKRRTNKQSVTDCTHCSTEVYTCQHTVCIRCGLEALFTDFEHMGVNVDHFHSCRRVVVDVFAVIQESHCDIAYTHKLGIVLWLSLAIPAIRYIPVPPATSKRVVPGPGAIERMKWSFHNRCTPPLMASFMISYLSATLAKTFPTAHPFAN